MDLCGISGDHAKRLLRHLVEKGAYPNRLEGEVRLLRKNRTLDSLLAVMGDLMGRAISVMGAPNCYAHSSESSPKS